MYPLVANLMRYRKETKEIMVLMQWAIRESYDLRYFPTKLAEHDFPIRTQLVWIQDASAPAIREMNTDHIVRGTN